MILGGGFAAVATARRLERRLRSSEAEITMVSRDNFTLFTPMLPEVSSGGLETRHIVTPVRAQLRRTQYVLAEITRIDLEEKAVDVQHSITGAQQTLTYDHLVLALGSVTSTFNIPGVAEHALPLKTIEDAERLRNRFIASLELADVTSDPAERERLLTYVVVGGGYTGCEAAGELVDLFHSVTRYYKSISRSHIKLYLIEAGKKLLADLPPGMGTYTTRNFERRGMDVVIGDSVAELNERAITLASGRRIPTATVLWSAGVRPSPVMQRLPVERARNGAVMTQRDFSVAGHAGLWALGDCAWIPMKTPGTWFPMTAQHAIREGPALADNIVATLRAQPTKEFNYTALGTMASLGARRGVAAFPGGFVLTGFLAWFLWRSYYLSRLPGLDRKVRVAFDWTLNLIFPRDIAELRVYTDRAITMAARDAGMGIAPTPNVETPETVRP